MAQDPSRTDHRKDNSEHSEISVMKGGLQAIDMGGFTPFELNSHNVLADTQHCSIGNDLQPVKTSSRVRSRIDIESEVHHE